MAGVFNSFILISIYADLTLHFGQGIVIFCLLVRGTIAVLLSSPVIAAQFGADVFVFLMVAEVMALAWARSRGIFLLLADLLYWTLIGVPVLYLDMALKTSFATEYVALILLKQVMNGTLYTAIVVAFALVLPAGWIYQTPSSEFPKLSSRIFHLSMLSTVLPALIVAIILTTGAVQEIERNTAENLRETAHRIGIHSEEHVDTHLRVIEYLGFAIQYTENPDALLAKTQEDFPGFITMLRTDQNGNVVAGVPEAFYRIMLEQPKPARTVKDREYFQQAALTDQPYISDVFQGRGFGNDPIVAMSFPLHIEGEFSGIVQGALDLPKFRQFENHAGSEAKGHLIIVTDTKNRVVYASENLAINLLAEFRQNDMQSPYGDVIPLLQFNSTEFHYSVSFDTLHDCADELLYASKEHGGNRLTNQEF